MHGIVGEYTDELTHCPKCGMELVEELQGDLTQSPVTIEPQPGFNETPLLPRPFGVTVIAGFLNFVCIFLGAALLFLLWKGLFSSYGKLEILLGVLILLLFFGIYCMAAIGLWRQQNWGRRATLALALLVTILKFPVGAIVGVPVFAYLVRPSMRRFFR